MLAPALLLLAAAAQADTEAQTRFERAPVAGHPVFDLRAGVGSTAPLAHPYLCGEVSPLAWLSLEGCGTGSGFLHQGDEPDIVHFRARFKMIERQVGRADGQLQVGAGFAEVQRTADELGFRFGRPTESDPVEAAGPEISLGAKGRFWTDRRTYLSLDLTGGVAHVPGAAAVLEQQEGPIVPFANLTAGFGF